MVRILITDDEPDIRQLICRFAQAAGYQTCEAANGEEAVELCKKHDFDVIVMDIMMPGIDGFAACDIVSRHQNQSLAAAPEHKVIVLNGLKIDLPGRNVFIDGQSIDLTAKEYDLLLYFIENKGIALTRPRILNGVWGYDYFGDDRTVDWQIKLLRNKLGDYRHYIVTLRGVGYKFEIKS